MEQSVTYPKHLVRKLRGHNGRVTAVRYTSRFDCESFDCVEDGNYCMSCGQDRSLCLWNPERDDMKDGFLIKRYKGPHSYCVNDVTMYD